MTHVGIDIEQFTRDPFGSGIQRVLQYLALEWPKDGPECSFVLPHRDGHLLLDSEQAARVLSVPFGAGTSDAGEIRALVASAIAQAEGRVVDPGMLISMLDGWLLPEVSYHPAVLQRLEMFAECMPVTMIGYDALPMIEPANYRFPPGMAAQVSQYFRMLTRADAVVCISEYSRASIWDRLRRERSATTVVAHPGGDHIPPLAKAHESSEIPTVIKVGTLESRKKPIETIDAFRVLRQDGIAAQLVLLGRPSSSDPHINAHVQAAVEEDIGVTWVHNARDDEVLERLAGASLFVSIGTEGYGIPVLEAISQQVPVVYGGIQPAAELMDGKGATRIDTQNTDSLARGLLDAINRRDELAACIDVGAIPTWRDFVKGVVSVL